MSLSGFPAVHDSPEWWVLERGCSFNRVLLHQGITLWYGVRSNIRDQSVTHGAAQYRFPCSAESTEYVRHTPDAPHCDCPCHWKDVSHA